jgi:tetratricopeptide (TPR) repeat protein
LNTAQFESLLTSIITQDGCIKVVEREKLALALKELAAVKLTDQQSAVRLGQLLTADAILSGFYAVDNGQVALSARLIDAGTGEIINVFELTGRWEDPQSLCRELGQQVVAASKVGRTAIDSPLLRWMESQTYLRGSDDKLAAAKIAGYVSPETADYYYQIGQEQRQHGEIEEALASYYNGLNKVGQTEDSWRFYEAIGELLDLLHRPEEAVQLWQRAVSDREGRSLDASPALLNLAYAELQLGHTQQVAEALSRIEKPTYLAGRMYEKIGRKSDAVPVYAAAAWERMPYFGRSLGGSYPALVRLLDDAGFAERTNVLSRMALVSGSDRPCQANKAAVELVRLGASINPAWLAGVTDSPKLEQHLREFADSRPNTLDCMQAYWRLATLYRERGDMMAERESLRKLEQEHVQGEQADRLRTMAERRVTTPWIRQPTPLAPSTASDQLPSQTEVGASDEQQTYRVDPLGVVYAVERTSDRILWRYDMHPRSVGGTRFRSATGTVEPAFCVVLAIRRHAYSCHGWRDELLASRSAGVGGHDGPWGWGVVRVQHHRRSVARH